MTMILSHIHVFITCITVFFQTSVLADEHIQCDALVESGKCRSDFPYMTEHCPRSCDQFLGEELNFRRFPISDDKKDELYDLNANTSTGSVINFERFEGFVTIILPLVKTCEGGQVSISTMIESIESLKAVWPYSVEIVVFPFEHPGLLYDDLNCDDFDAEYAKNERNIYMMEMSELNGDNAHPIFKAIKEIMKDEESGTNVNVDKLNYFIIDPDWEILHHHYNKSLMDIKDVLREMIKVLDPVDEL